jgi:peptidoglycan-associated lipoprotein
LDNMLVVVEFFRCSEEKTRMITRIAKSSVGAALALALSLGFTACSDDQQAVDEPVDASLDGAPPPPPGEVLEPEVDSLAEAAESSAAFTPETVYFGFDEYSLTPEARQKLDGLANHLKSSANAAVQIEGHCDERGSIEYNLALGERRSQAVKNYLVQSGVDGARLSTISYGEEKPAVEGHSEEAWSRNRRVEFTVSSQ